MMLLTRTALRPPLLAACGASYRPCSRQNHLFRWAAAAGHGGPHQRSFAAGGGAGDGSSDKIQDFFEQFSHFSFDSSRPYSEEFRRLKASRPECQPAWSEYCRLRRSRRWTAEWEEYRRLRESPAWTTTQKKPWQQWIEWQDEYITAQKMEFGAEFGAQEDDPVAWLRLCQTAGIDPIPPDLKGRRQRILDTHINLVDMLEARRLGYKATIFETEPALAAYTRTSERYFPREKVHGLLKWLLRQILNKYDGRRGKGYSKKKSEKPEKPEKPVRRVSS